jgi:hypothetical protein
MCKEQMDKTFITRYPFDSNLYIKVEGKWVMEWKGVTQNGDKVRIQQLLEAGVYP